MPGLSVQGARLWRLGWEMQAMPLTMPINEPMLSSMPWQIFAGNSIYIDLVLCQATLPLELFSLELYTRYNIALPVRIAKSITKRQRDFFIGRLAAHKAMENIMYAPPDLNIGEAGNPLWPKEIEGSISHTNNMAVASAFLLNSMPMQHLGLDIELVVNHKAAYALKTQTMNEIELQRLNTHTQHIALNTLLTLVFSAKESFYKAAFSRVMHLFGFNALELQSIDIHARTLLFYTTSSIGAHFAPSTPIYANFQINNQPTGENYVLTAVALT